jgi:RNA polymerase sigma-70 factor (ECF subfamily)
MSPDWPWERFRALVRVQTRRMELDPRFRLRFSDSDLVQETLMRAHRRRDQFRGGSEGEAVAWLYVILRRVVADKLAEAHAIKQDIDREQALQALDDSSARLEALLADRGPSPSEAAERNEQVARLGEAIERLAEDQRDAFIRRHLIGMPVVAVAAEMGCSESAVGGLLYRANCKLRELLKEG